MSNSLKFGYPYNVRTQDDSIYASDLFVLDNKYFWYGFMSVFILAPGAAFADEACPVPVPIGETNHTMSKAAAIAKLAVISSACGTTAKCIEGAAQQTVQEASKANPKLAVTVEGSKA